MKNIKIVLFSILVFSLQWSFATTQSVNQTETGIFDLMNFQEVVEINLEMDVNNVISNRRSSDKHPALLSFVDEKGNEQAWDINVNLRGKFRRMKCEEMPPLKLNFKKEDLKIQGLGKFDDLKLVTYCVEDKEEAKELLLKEYLAYKLFNQITEESFRVQLLKINYIDFTTNETKQHYGVLIEDTAQMRKRIGAIKVKAEVNNKAEAFHTEEVKRVALFQYMIGNFDWDIRAVRNVKLVKKGEKFIAVPYDFDFSFLVDAPYASTEPTYQIKKRGDRVYLGFEEDLKNMEEVTTLFLSKKTEIYQTVKDFKLLKGSTRKKIIRYLDSFYKNIDDIKPIPEKQLADSNMGE